MESRLDAATIDRLISRADDADRRAHAAWPGPPATRQPVQVLYVPADRVTATATTDAGAEARRLLDTHAPDAAELARAFGLHDLDLAASVRQRIVAKLDTEPVEDLRVDFEDGYLGVTDDEEDAAAVATARAIATASEAGTAPPFVGLRVASFSDGLARRSIRTLERFVATLVEALGRLPDGFVVTFPKIVAVDHVAAFAEVLGHLEQVYGLPERRLRFEAQIETTPSVLGVDGRVVLRDIRDAADGRLCGAHLGVYDYTAGLRLPPGEQRLEHPACDFVRHLLQVTFAGTEVRLSDGSTNAVPSSDRRDDVHAAWARHAAGVRHSLAHGYVQGWDLHPSHLVSRYAVVFADLLDRLDETLDRLQRWDERERERDAAGSGVLDEPATIRRLEDHLQRAVDSRAVDPDEVVRRCGRRVDPRPARWSSAPGR